MIRSRVAAGEQTAQTYACDRSLEWNTWFRNVMCTGLVVGPAGYSFLGILLSGMGLTLLAVAILNHGWPGGLDLRSLVAMILCSVLGYVFLGLALRSKVILEGDRLTVRYAFGEDSAQIGKIAGYRIVRSRSGTYWALRLRNGGSITIMWSYAVDDYFRDFISRLKPLKADDEP